MRKITIAGAIGALKGVCTVSDAKLAVELGADAVILSNHGGRQLDRAVAKIAMVADVRAALGPEVEILVDSGIRSGVDIAAAVASGAQWLRLIGRADLYGLMAGGPRGVAYVLDILAGNSAESCSCSAPAPVVDSLRTYCPELADVSPRAR